MSKNPAIQEDGGEDALDAVVSEFFSLKQEFSAKDEDIQRLESQLRALELQQKLGCDMEMALQQELNSARELVLQLQSTLNALSPLQEENQSLKEQLKSANEAKEEAQKIHGTEVRMWGKRELVMKKIHQEELDEVRLQGCSEVEKIKEQLLATKNEMAKKDDEFACFSMAREQEMEGRIDMLKLMYDKKLKALEEKLNQTERREKDANTANQVTIQNYQEKLLNMKNDYEKLIQQLTEDLKKNEEHLKQQLIAQHSAPHLNKHNPPNKHMTTPVLKVRALPSGEKRQPLNIETRVIAVSSCDGSTETSAKTTARCPKKRKLFYPSKDLT